MAENQFQAAVVGQESIYNLRLADLLRKLIGKENVFRFLEIKHLLEYLSIENTHPVGIFIDLFTFDLPEAIQSIGYVRNQYPKAVFCIYLSNLDFSMRWTELPSEWGRRLRHYFKLFKESDDTELEPIVRRILQGIVDEAVGNLSGTPLKLTEDTGTSLPPHITKTSARKLENSLFISYSRTDWDSFVSPLVNRLRDRGYSIWVDQHLLVGGVDWMDAIGSALDDCKLLLLIMSPEALDSKFVKMEYRYFFNHDKTIIPLLYRQVERVPPELSITQYIDFCGKNIEPAFSQLIKVIEANLVSM